MLVPFCGLDQKTRKKKKSKVRTTLPADSYMASYLSLESGKLLFPAQVYNRENGHIGFMLPCYDAQLSCNSQSGTFLARYSPHGRRTIEDNISQDRLRALNSTTNASCLGFLHGLLS